MERAIDLIEKIKTFSSSSGPITRSMKEQVIKTQLELETLLEWSRQRDNNQRI